MRVHHFIWARPAGLSATARLTIATLCASIAFLVAGAADAGEPGASAQPAVAVESFRWPGEEFYYSIRLNGAEAMRASVRAGDLRRVNDRAYVPISGTARSVGFFEKIYPLDDRAHTFVDPSDHRPLRSEKYFKERGKTRTYKVDYAHNAFRAQVEKKREERTNRYNYSIPSTTHDMFSWMYDLRSRPSLAVGDEISYYIYDGWKLSRVDLEVVGKEDVYTPMGWFKGWKISFVREVLVSKRQKSDEGAPQTPKLKVKSPRDKTGFLWLSRDENRLPIKVSIGTKFGTSEALLVKYTPHVKTAPKKKRDVQTADSSNRSEAR